MTIEQLKVDILDIEYTQAVELVESNGFTIRKVWEDGYFLTGLDYKPDRIDVWVEQGKITRA